MKIEFSTLVDKAGPRGTIVIREVWGQPGGVLRFGKPYATHNLVVNGGRSHVANILYDAAYNHKLGLLQCGTGSNVPALTDVALTTSVTTPVLPTEPSMGPDAENTGTLRLSWLLPGGFFSGNFNLREFGLFVEDSANLGNPLIVSGNPLMFSRVVLAAPVNVYPPTSGGKGVAITWYVQF